MKSFEKCDNTNCEFFVIKDRIETQIGLYTLQNYLTDEQIDNGYNEALQKHIKQYRIKVNDEVTVILEPVDLRDF